MLGRMVRTVERHRHNISNTCPQECVGNGARQLQGKRYMEKCTTRPTGKTQQKHRKEGSGRGEGREGNGGYNALLGGRKSKRYSDRHTIFGGKFERYIRQYTLTYGLVYVHDDTLAVHFAGLGFFNVYISYSVRILYDTSAVHFAALGLLFFAYP